MKQKQKPIAEDLVDVVKDTHLLDEASLERGGFAVDSERQQRFLALALHRRYTAAEFSRRPSFMFEAAAALSAAFFIGAALRGHAAPMFVAALSVALTSSAAFFRGRARRRAALKDGPPNLAACFVDDEHKLSPRLEPGERVLFRGPAAAPVRALPRRFVGAMFTGWGALLAGLPLATMPVIPDAPSTLFLVALGTAFGALLFGRGVDALVMVRPVDTVALTNQRFVFMLAPGVAESVPLESIRHRPSVVGRNDGTASLVIDLRPQKSTSPLPFHALVGVDGLAPEVASTLAGQVMDHRLNRLRQKLVVDVAS